MVGIQITPLLLFPTIQKTITRHCINQISQFFNRFYRWTCAVDDWTCRYCALDFVFVDANRNKIQILKFRPARISGTAINGWLTAWTLKSASSPMIYAPEILTLAAFIIPANVALPETPDTSRYHLLIKRTVLPRIRLQPWFPGQPGFCHRDFASNTVTGWIPLYLMQGAPISKMSTYHASCSASAIVALESRGPNAN